jgi:N-methylhydantoinase A
MYWCVEEGESSDSMLVVGVDTGGTFTDFVVHQDGHLHVHKVLSTPADPAQAILTGLSDLGIVDADAIIHGSTVATNAVLEQKGANVGLITTAGFRDVLEIGRQDRPKLYDLRVVKQPPLVPRHQRVEVLERLNEHGEVLTPLEPESIELAIRALRDANVESVAICLLFSFANPKHERRVTRRVREMGLEVSASHEVLPEFREYERTSTVVLNAYVGPLMSRYLRTLESSLPESTPLRIMQSNGGSISAAMAGREAARTLLSGPAAGAVGAAYVAAASGHQQSISFDMGGTSTDVALIDGGLIETTDGTVGGYPTRLPMIDIHTVGAGGGSIAWFDAGGALKVGPRSAGATPGPAAYARGGTEATVTDANVVLGRLNADDFVAGDMHLDVDAARRALKPIADRLGGTVEEAALGIIRIVNANMEAAIRVISVQKGYDPRQFTLVAYGGAGPLHACELASIMRIPRVLVPATPGVLSAYGMLAADIRKDYVQTLMLEQHDDMSGLADVFDTMSSRARAEIASEKVAEDRIRIERYLDIRYSGQSHELTVRFESDVKNAVEAFGSAHQRQFGYSDVNEPVQIVNARVKAFGQADRPVIQRTKPHANAIVPPATQRKVVFPVEQIATVFDTPIYEREQLVSGLEVSGPAIVTQYDTTTVLSPGWTMTVDETGSLIFSRHEGHKSSG